MLSLEQLKTLFPSGSYLDRRGKNLIAECPVCGHKEFGISLEGYHRYGCFRKVKCGASGNIFSLLKLLGREDMIVSTGRHTYQQLSTLESMQEEYELKLDLPDYDPPLGWKRIFSHPYLEERGFTEFERYKVGVSLLAPKLGKDYVVFLIEENGSCKGFIGRNTKSKEEIEIINERYKRKGLKKKVLRYRNSDSDFGKLAFGLDEIIQGETKTLIIVEGIFDKFNIDKLLDLHNQTAIKCNSTFKCGCSPEQIYKWLYLGIEKIILLYDPDVLKEIKKAAFELQKHFQVLVGFNENGSDPGDMTLDELEVVFSNLKLPEEFDMDRIENKSQTFKV
jgi:DNA primase